MACYKRAYRRGELPKRPTSASERFYSHVNREGPISQRAPHLGPCWLWEANRLPSGYGITSKGGRLGTTLAHRFAYELEIGPIPEKATIDHLCVNPPCVRWNHLEAVSQKVNNNRSDLAQFKVNAVKTHCPQGHPYDETNTIHRVRKSDGGISRQCRACLYAAVKRYQNRTRHKSPS